MGEGGCSSPKELEMKKLIYFLKSNSGLPCCSLTGLLELLLPWGYHPAASS